MEKLVSIVSPCYNGEKYINAYALSLLNQNYSNCQLIFMDDGSKDRTKELIMSYKNKFEEKGFKFEYYYHENIGVGATIAEGIKYVKGEYLIWPDIDDLMPSNSIKTKVEFLENRQELGLVRTDYKKVYESDLTHPIEYGAQKFPERIKEELFMDYLMGKNMWLQPGCYMIRMKCFDNANPDRFIYPTRTGQNWQMLLPVLYHYKCGYLDEALYTYILHKGSMSDESKDTYQQKCVRLYNYEKLILETLNHMKVAEIEELTSIVKRHYSELGLTLAFDYYKKNDALKNYQWIKINGKVSWKMFLKAYGAKSKFIHHIVYQKKKMGSDSEEK